MSYRDDLLAQLAEIQRKLNLIDNVPEDTFNFGTLLLFSSPNAKWYYVKTGEETWRNMQTTVAKDLASWVFEAIESPIGYFEIYVLSPGETPIFASA